MTLIQSIMYGIFAGAFVLIILKAFEPMIKPYIIKYIKNREEKKNVQKERQNNGSSNSNTANTTSSKQYSSDNSGRISGPENNNGKQQSVGSEYKNTEQTKQYKSIFN